MKKVKRKDSEGAHNGIFSFLNGFQFFFFGSNRTEKFLREISEEIERLDESDDKEWIAEQMDTIKKATEKASKSKESAKKFLVDAGIIRKR